MSKLVSAYLRQMTAIHEDSPMRTDRLWVTKILYEWMSLGQRIWTDVYRDIIYHAERIEPDKVKWDISAEEYEGAIAELRKKYPQMNS
jgi:hypothetical protein